MSLKRIPFLTYENEDVYFGKDVPDYHKILNLMTLIYNLAFIFDKRIQAVSKKHDKSKQKALFFMYDLLHELLHRKEVNKKDFTQIVDDLLDNQKTSNEEKEQLIFFLKKISYPLDENLDKHSGDA
jgi:hypothetical protein